MNEPTRHFFNFFKGGSMNKIIVITLLMLSWSVEANGETTGRETSVDMEQTEAMLLQQAREQTQAFAQSLKQRLTTAMADGGVVHAVQVCNLEAADIAARHSDEKSWSVGRTSLKVRNIANIPDPWEREVLQMFEQRKAAGSDVSTLEYGAVVTSQGRKMFRYMKAIPTGKLCLACHGGDGVSPQVNSELHQRYPQDQARGFQVGDIRGAFTLTRELE